MAIEVIWSKRAREDLLGLYVVIGMESPNAAERILDRIERRAEQLARQPRMGPRRTDIRPGVRLLVESNWLILYEVHPDADDCPVVGVEIVAVVDGRRDLGRI